MKSMIDWAEKVNEKAKVNIESAQQKQKKRYDAKRKPPIFSIGEKVWKYNGRKDTRKGGKLDWNWTGPYEVAECTTRGTYRLKNKKGLQLKQAVSSIHLKAVIDGKKLSKVNCKEEAEEVNSNNAYNIDLYRYFTQIPGYLQW